MTPKKEVPPGQAKKEERRQSGRLVPKWVVRRKEALQTVGLRSFDAPEEAGDWAASQVAKQGVTYVVEEDSEFIPGDPEPPEQEPS